MGSLTNCIKKAGKAITAEDKAAVLERAAELREGGASANAAAMRAVDEQIAALTAKLAESGVKWSPENSEPGPSAAPAAAVSVRPDSRDSEEIAKAKQDALDALADLGDIFADAVGARKFMIPPPEQKLMPVLTRLLDAAFRLGHIKFKQAAKWALDQMRAHPALGEEKAALITLDHLQGAYIGMAGGKEGASTKREVIEVESLSEIEAYTEPQDAPSTDAVLERDRPDAGNEVAPVGGDVQPIAGATVWSDGRPEQSAQDADAGRPGDSGVPAGRAAAGGERGNQPVLGGDRQSAPTEFDARTSDGGRSGDSGIQGVPPETIPTEAIGASAETGLGDAGKRTAQRAAEKVAVKLADLDNIKATLPYLLPGQQEDVFKAETRFQKPDGYGIMFTNGTGTGKAQPLDAKLMTPSGWRLMGEIKPGDEVVGVDGKPTRVLAVYPQGDKPIYRVTFSDGAVTECCDEHLWETQTLYARRKARANAAWDCAQPQVRSLAEIRASIAAQHFVPVASALELEEVDLALPPYIMGALLGDGCITQNAITFATADPDIAERVTRDLPDSMELRLIADGKRCPQYRISLREQVRRASGQMEQHPWLRALRDMGLHGADSAAKFIPADYLRGSIQQRTELLQGLLDTDGWVDAKSRSPYFTSISRDLADAVAFLSRSLGGTATINTKRPTYSHQGEKRNGQLAYNVCINLPDGIAPFALTRKAVLYQPNTKYPPRRKIIDVEPIGIKPAQCIAVDHPRHLYVTDDCIVTHNTYSGLGIIKRFERQGKTNTLIVVPDNKIMSDWVESAKPLGLTVTPLTDTKDAGQGITITTYANLGDNDAIASREWDLIVPDEAHSLMQASDGKATKALDAVRALSWHPRGVHDLHSMLHRDELDELKQMSEQFDINSRLASKDDTMEAMRKDLLSENEKLEKRMSALRKSLDDSLQELKAKSKAKQGATRTRVAFLSATPFAYERNIDFAEGYLFDYRENYPHDETSLGYNVPRPFEYFMMTHFGYSMRVNKLTEPGPKVNRGLMQRQFNAWLRSRGVLSSRMLEVDADYDRRFVLVDSAIGNKIDEALAWIDMKRQELAKQKDTFNPYGALQDELSDRFYGKQGHLVRRYLLEAIKAKEIIPHIKAQLQRGRKVVVFHDFNKGGSSNPFAFSRITGAPEGMAGDDLAQFKQKAEAINAAIDEFNKEFKVLTGDLMADLVSPIVRFQREFPDVLLINGKEKASDLLRRYKQFNDDERGPVVALVQSDKNKGWSGHDTTGKHQRVLYNLGMPTAPTKAIQQEGRIYRTGQVSDAMFRYINTGTNWERWAFASTIAERAGTAENLAMGEQARALKESFIAAFESADSFQPGHEGEGKGGKAFDQSAEAALTEWDRAISFYWGTQKKNSKTKAQEGEDYFATPEPVGLKMVQWADGRVGEDFLEPSGGHGAIARWAPDNMTRTAIEPSTALGSRMALVFDGKIIQGKFEELHISNKFDAIAMNPPFGTAGRTAIDHLAKAAESHLRDGGRVVALIPEGPAADKKFDAWFYEEATRDLKPLTMIQIDGKLTPVYVGDEVTTNASWAKAGRVVSSSGGALVLKLPQVVGNIAVAHQGIKTVEPTGKRKETYRPAENLHMVAQVHLPNVTFERAGTGVKTRIVVIEKLPKGQSLGYSPKNIDLSDVTDIEALFKRLESIELPKRQKEELPEVPEVAKTGPVSAGELTELADSASGESRKWMDDAVAFFAKGQTNSAAQSVGYAVGASENKSFATQARKMERRLYAQRAQAKTQATAAGVETAKAEGIELVEHTTAKGKILKGVIRKDLSLAQAKEIDAYTFKKDGGLFIRAEHLDKLKEYDTKGGAAPILSQSSQTDTIEAVRTSWDIRGIQSAIFERGGVITLSKIIVPSERRGAGVGTEAMNELTTYADRTGQRIALSPSGDFGGSKGRLVPFYKRFGFVENKGRNKDFTISESMVREPLNRGTFDPQNPSILLSQAPKFKPGTAKASIQAMVDASRASWSDAPPVTVVDSVDGLPTHIQDAIASQSATGTVRALVMPDTGRVYLIADRLKSVDEAQFVLFHEVLGHYGMRKFMGDKYAPELDKLRKANPALAKEAMRWFQAYGRGHINTRTAGGMDFTQAVREVSLLSVEEALADRAGDAKPLSGFKAFMAKVQAALRNIGLGKVADMLEGMTEAETFALLAHARRSVESGPARESFAIGLSGPLNQQAFHGTPYRGIEKFSTDKIGTGEGAQAFGWGLYFTDKREIAEYYRETLGQGRFTINGAPFEPGNYSINELVGRHKGSDAELSTKLRRYAQWNNGNPFANTDDALKIADAIDAGRFERGAPGQTYKVEIPDDSDMLLWDKTIGQQPEKVLKALKDSGIAKELRENLSDYASPMDTRGKLKGENIYAYLRWKLGSEKAASERLRELGVLGINYPAGTIAGNTNSRARNYVIFSGDDVRDIQPLLSQPDPIAESAMRKAGVGPRAGIKQRVGDAFGRALELLKNRKELAAEAQQAGLDQFTGIKRAVERELGNLPAEQDPYVAARLANGGTSSVMRGILMHGQAQWAANGQHLEKKPDTKGLLQILEPLGDDLNDWFGWMIGNRAARLMTEGRENNFTADEIKALQALGTPEKLAKFRAVSMEYTAFKRSVLDIAEQAGLIDPEGRKVWDRADWIPFYRQIDEKATFSATGKRGMAGQSSGIRTLKGGSAGLNDPMENLLMNFSRLIDASLKNNALRRTLEAFPEGKSTIFEKVGYQMTGQIVPAGQIKKQLIDSGTPEEIIGMIPQEVFDGMAKMWAIQAPQDPDVIRVMVGGKPQFYRVSDGLMLKALTSFIPFDFPGLGAMRAFKRLLTATVTSTPEFMVRNFIRDTVASQMIAREGINPAMSMKGIVESYKETGAYEAMLFAGASFQGGQVSAADPTGTATAIRRSLRAKGMDAASIDAFMGSILDLGAKGWDKYRSLTDAVENANREAVYEAAMKTGKGATTAAYEAKDLMDFNLRGSSPIYQFFADVLPFFNARVQGMYRLYRADPKVFTREAFKTKLVQYGLLMTAASVALAIANSGDDDDWYAQLPDWDKDTYWHFRIGGEHFRVPKPFELGVVFATIPERITRYVTGDDTGTKLAKRVYSNVRDQLAIDPVPQVFRPALDVYRNRDAFRDAPIENMGDQNKPDNMRYGPTTSATMRELANVAPKVTNFVGLSPKELEHLFTGYLGTVGSYGLALSDAAVRRIAGDPERPTMRADDFPVIKAFYRQDPARATVFESDLYDLREKLNKIYAGVRALEREGKPEDAAKERQANARELAVRPTVERSADTLSRLRKQRNAVLESRTMTPDQKRSEADRLQESINRLTQKTMQSEAVRGLQ